MAESSKFLEKKIFFLEVADKHWLLSALVAFANHGWGNGIDW